MRCKSYVGVACINGSCPIANAEEYEERGIPVVNKCIDCFYYKGCDDCGLYDTEYCDKTVFAENRKGSI